MSTARRILSNTVVQVLAKIIIAGMGIISVKYISLYLGKEVFGQYTIIYEFLAIFGIFADMGLFTIGLREMGKHPEQKSKIISQILAMRGILATVVASTAVVTAYLLPRYSGDVFEGIMIAALAMVVAFIGGTLSTVLQVALEMHKAAIALVMGRIISTSYIVYAVISGLPFYHLILGGLMGNVLYMILIWFFTSKHIHLTAKLDWKWIYHIFIDTIPYGLAIVMSTLYFRLGSIFIYQLHGAGETGIYGVAMKFYEISGIIPVFFMNSVMPTLSRLLREGSEKVSALISHSWDFLLLIATPIFAGSIPLGYKVVIFISSAEFISAAIPLQILLAGMIFLYLSALFGYLIVAAGKQTWLLWTNLVGVAINVSLNLYLVPTIGAAGAATTAMIVEVFVLIVTFVLASRIVKFHIKPWQTLKIISSATVMGGVLWPIRDAELWLTLPLGILIYVLMIFITRGVDPAAIALIRRK